MCAPKGGYEDLTKEILRFFLKLTVSLYPVIIQCDKVSLSNVEKLHANETREQVLRFAPKTSHQSNGFVEAVHRHMQGLARSYQTQIETNTGMQFSAISPAIPFAIHHAGFVLSRSQCDQTAAPHSNICSEHHMYHLCACLVNQCSRSSPITKCEQPN